jgi:4-amino-4-deoxy-L-arabinose transferase-like glycosyltransferase
MKPRTKELNDPMTMGQPSAYGLEKWASLTPWLVFCYFAVQLCVRLVVASPLEVDDAEMVGQIHWALGYSKSHPPLYHWLVRICYDLFHSWPAATAFPKYALQAAAYLLIYHAARRVSGSAVAGAVAVAFFFFIPVVWKTQTKLTHSILGFTATAALLHSLVCILFRPGWKAFTWLGVAAAIGLLAKYNFLLVLLSAVIAALAVGDVRRLFRTRTAFLAVAIPVLLTLPHLLWVLAHPRLTTENMYRLQTAGGPLGMNLRADSVWDGLVSLLLVTATSVVPMFLLCLTTALIFRGEGAAAESKEISTAKIARQFLGWMVLSELVIFIVVVLAGGFSQVHERYLVVLLPPLPLWLALSWRASDRRQAATAILVIAGVLAILITVGTAVARTKAKRTERPLAYGAMSLRRTEDLALTATSVSSCEHEKGGVAGVYAARFCGG